ncbi:unnamed protein product [Hermetia illucens]|uniref:Uncharacterized protein n=1 Tax=Hermetia illucens TaxID=343691 RepID=A0A7R8V5K5_HERIL|nr:unnamed protein product [Hermetia illucens]
MATARLSTDHANGIGQSSVNEAVIHIRIGSRTCKDYGRIEWQPDANPAREKQDGTRIKKKFTKTLKIRQQQIDNQVVTQYSVKSYNRNC